MQTVFTGYGYRQVIYKTCPAGLDGYKHKRNLNTLVIGGSGAGKTRGYALPNIMQCNSSFVITDPKAEILRTVGNPFSERRLRHQGHGFD